MRSPAEPLLRLRPNNLFLETSAYPSLFPLLQMNGALDPKRTVAELKELRALTGDENGAQRVAFTPTWAKARRWLRAKLEEIPTEVHQRRCGKSLGDAARPIGEGAAHWRAHRFGAERRLARWLPEYVGRRRDSPPHQPQYKGKPPVTVRLVDWADEEGARFGKSLFGSSACSGNLDMDGGARSEGQRWHPPSRGAEGIRH